MPQQQRRLTPNSRNVHQQWLPLAPGLGCGGLLYGHDDHNNVKQHSNQPASGSGTGTANDDLAAAGNHQHHHLRQT